MKYLFCINLLFILLSSCSPTTKTDFQKTVEKSITIRLPFSDTCGKDLKNVALIEKGNPLFKYLPNASVASNKLALVGKIVETNKFIALLLVDTYSDYQMHYIGTFTNEGGFITKFELFKVGCSADENYFGHAEYTITKDKLIKLKDSTADYKRDSSGNIINESIVSKSHIHTFKFADDGSIIQKQ